MPIQPTRGGAMQLARESVVKQMSDDPATEKTGSTENRDEPAMAGCAVGKVFCPGPQPACPPGRSEPSIPHEAKRLHLSMLRRSCLSTLVNEQPGAPEARSRDCPLCLCGTSRSAGETDSFRERDRRVRLPFLPPGRPVRTYHP